MSSFVQYKSVASKTHQKVHHLQTKVSKSESLLPVQDQCIPKAIEGADILCQARSGMGKTLCYVLAILQTLVPIDGQISCLVLCHARELLHCIGNEFNRMKKYLQPAVKVDLFYGGIPLQRHKDLLKNEPPHIALGTPGRISVLLQDKSFDLKHLKYFIIDECNTTLDPIGMMFHLHCSWIPQDLRSECQRIFVKSPRGMQVMMFHSYPLNDNLRTSCMKYMRNVTPTPLEL